MDGGITSFPASSDGRELARKAMGYTLTYSEKMNLAEATPQDSLNACSTQYCLVNPGKQYLIYQPNSGGFNVNMAVGEYNYEWFNPNTGSVVETGSVTVEEDGHVDFVPPFYDESSVLLLETDTDDDGLPDAFEVGCTSPENADSDDDGLTDGTEDTNRNGIVDTGETDPCNADTDGDGLPDGFETANGLNPLLNDSRDDFDGDGFSNLREFISNTDPGDNQDIPGLLCDRNADGDVDGMELSQLTSEMGRTDCTSPACYFDLNGDGGVDAIDLFLFGEDFSRRN
jgi:hypothetical protein